MHFDKNFCLWYDKFCCNSPLTHWSWVMHIWVSKLTIIGSHNGLSPDRPQAIIWTNAGILSIGPLGTNFSEVLIEIHTLLFRKMHLKMLSGKWQPFCLSLNVLKRQNFHNTKSLLCLLMAWQQQQPGHNYTWYSIFSPNILGCYKGLIYQFISIFGISAIAFLRSPLQTRLLFWLSEMRWTH